MKTLMCLLLVSVAAILFLACGRTSTRSTTSRDSTSGQPFLGDGDFDQGDGDGDNGADNDNDAPFDYYDRHNESWNRGVFRDRDDTATITLGHGAGTADARAVSRVVTLYYEAASRDDGRSACRLLLPSVAKRIADFRLTGIPYLRGSKTCAEAMRKLLRHYSLSVPQVTSVRIQGDAALALWGSRRMPAGYITLSRWRDGWGVTAPVGSILL